MTTESPQHLPSVLKGSFEGSTVLSGDFALTRMIRRQVTDQGICLLIFDRPDSAANLFDRATLEELDRQLDLVAGDPQLKGLVLASAKKSIFIAGADIHAMMGKVTDADLQHLIALGQAVFNRISVLPIPSVAAIHGAALGGGYEICLACDYRIASPERETKIGLPETQLGILPAWGGSTRLPRLIGLPKALDVILAGKTLAARPAFRCGMVDELVPREYLLDVAQRKILESGLALRDRRRPLKFSVLNHPLAARILARRLQSTIQAKTRGHYPAIPKALSVVTQGITTSIEQSLALEADAILELARTPAARSLIQVFLLQERAKKISYPGAQNGQGNLPIKKVAVLGAGVMGAGIAQWCSAREIPVILKDVSPDQVAKGMATIGSLYAEATKRHTFTQAEARSGFDRIFPTAADVPLKNVDLVIEAAIEKMAVKKEIFSALDQAVSAQTILATNTSALSVSELAQTTQYPDRVIGIHFFNPVHRMQLVEIVVGPQTRPDVVQRSIRFVQQIGKLPVVVKDSPGFLVNRILMPYLIEAGRLFESGAPIKEIDEAMLDFGMPMGPLRLIDEVGVDVAQHVARTLASQFSGRMESPAVLGKMLEAKMLGRKGGQGFYLHRRGEKRMETNPEVEKFRTGSNAAALSREDLQNRMVLLMVNEAVLCFEEGLVGAPDDVDFGMIMGTGFAPFLGGPLRFADFIGARQLVTEMKRLAETVNPRFAPCTMLDEMATRGTRFYP